MSASIEDTVLDPLDGGKALKNRLKKAFCEPGNIVDNPPLTFAKLIIFPLLAGKRELFYCSRLDVGVGEREIGLESSAF